MTDLSSKLAELAQRGLVVRHETPEGPVFGVDPLVAAQIADWMAVHPTERQGLTEEQVSVSLGRSYAASFEVLADGSEPDALEQAAEEAQHALQALLQGQAFGELGDFAGRLVTGSRDPFPPCIFARMPFPPRFGTSSNTAPLDRAGSVGRST